MEPALDVLGRALQGDDGARAFLERTSSIYVLDVTDQANPKTYGCWNFIHQALNEIERKDSVLTSNNNNNNNHDNSAVLQESPLTHHVRLLASMALRVARRSPQGDRAIVATCIANASEYHCSPSQSQWLFDLNLELREIVMGRIAAMAFDFTFHKQSAMQHMPNHQEQQQDRPLAPQGFVKSAFADVLVLDTFCAILAANAVTSGEIKHFATEWIIPSSRSIPVAALVSVAKHLAMEGMRAAAPAGTMNDLQTLSVAICSLVLVPIMADAVTENHSSILENSIRTLHMWSRATTLTLPQVKHIATKVNLDMLEILSDILSSGSMQALEALADYLEHEMEAQQVGTFSIDRMNQVRHILQVSESAFHANFGAAQLQIIERKEMGDILNQLVSAIGLQRMRFIERENQGDLGICRNLARIVRNVAGSWLNLDGVDRQESTERSIIEFLLKVAHHPSIHVSGMVLEIFPKLFPRHSQLARETIPLLQRKVIIPHRQNGGVSGGPEIMLVDNFGVSPDEFLRFRDYWIADALRACWVFQDEAYIESCSSAIIEFCGSLDGRSFSFHLEAALFCLEVIGPAVEKSKVPFAFESHLARCFKAVLQTSSQAILENPLTASRLCSLIQKWSFWFDSDEKMGAAVDLASRTFSGMLRLREAKDARKLQIETGSLPIQQCALAFEALLSNGASKATWSDRSKATPLLDLWKSSYTTCKHEGLSLAENLAPFGKGLCLATLEGPKEFHISDFDSILAPCIESISALSASLNKEEAVKEQSSQAVNFCEDLKVLEMMVSACSVPRISEDHMEVDDDKESLKTREVPPPLQEALYNLWPTVKTSAERLDSSQDVICVFSRFCSSMIPMNIESNNELLRLKDLGKVVVAQLNSAQADSRVFGCVCGFLKNWAMLHCEAIDRGSTPSKTPGEMSDAFKSFLTQVILKAQTFLGASWTEIKEQIRGQDAFETRSPPSQRSEQNSLYYLEPLLALLRLLLVRCPLFLAEMEIGSDKLIQQAISSAVFALGASESAQLSVAIDFLQQVTKEARQCEHESIRSLLLENLTGIREGIVVRLLMGLCGKYDRSLLEVSCRLFFSLGTLFSTAEIESDSLSALLQDFFYLGDKGKKSTLSIISDCLRGHTALERFSEYAEQLWELHRSSDSFYLPNSDAVARLLRSLTG